MPEGWKGDPKVLSAGKAIYVVEAKPSVKCVMVRTASLRKLAVERRIFPTIRRSALKVLMLSGSGEFQKGSARP